VVLLGVARAQQPSSHVHGVIFGRVIDQSGQPARGLQLVAYPLNALLATALPFTRTDQDGLYRFEDIPWWGRFTIVPNDPEAGYSQFATGAPLQDGKIQQVSLAQEHPEAELNFRLPPKAGFLKIYLKNKGTGEKIADLHVVLYAAEPPNKPIFGGTGIADRPVLIPPGRHLLLHVDATGYKEWERSAGKGFPLYMSSGERRTLEIQLATTQ
jgi:hypothetical protein